MMTLLLAMVLQDADSLIKQLGDADPGKRDEATTKLKTLDPASKSIDEKIEAATSKEDDQEILMRARAILRHRRLSRCAGDVNTLERLVGSPDLSERLRAVRALLRAGEAGDPLLVEVLDGAPPEVFAAVEEGVRNARRASLKPAVHMLVEKGNGYTSGRALLTLGTLDNDGARTTALAWVRAAIENAETFTNDEGYECRFQSAMNVLSTSKLAPGDIDLLWVGLGTEDMWGDWILDAIQFSPELRRQSLDIVKDRYDQFESYRRAHAAAVLAKAGDAEKLADFRERLRSQEFGASVVGFVYALGRLKDEDSIPVLLRKLKYAPMSSDDGSEDLWERTAAATAWALCEIGQRDALSSLLEIWKDHKATDQEYHAFSGRPMMFRAIGRLGDASYAETLTGALGQDDERVRAAAVLALGDLGARAAVPALMERIDDLVGFDDPGESPLEWDSALRVPDFMAPPRTAMVTVRDAVLRSLEKLVGQKFGGKPAEQAAKWKSWWGENKATWK